MQCNTSYSESSPSAKSQPTCGLLITQIVPTEINHSTNLVKNLNLQHASPYNGSLAIKEQTASSLTKTKFNIVMLHSLNLINATLAGTSLLYKYKICRFLVGHLHSNVCGLHLQIAVKFNSNIYIYFRRKSKTKKINK